MPPREVREPRTGARAAARTFLRDAEHDAMLAEITAPRNTNALRRAAAPAHVPPPPGGRDLRVVHVNTSAIIGSAELLLRRTIDGGRGRPTASV